MERVRLARCVDGAARRDECLREHLPSEHSARADVAIPTAVDVDLERLQIEEIQQVGEGHCHWFGWLGFVYSILPHHAGDRRLISGMRTFAEKAG
jgi:hypothetical protein